MTATAKDFSCVGGLENHIQILKETVLFPLMYGDIYTRFNVKPPRGLLFYGPPGTGKTLMASALALECSNAGRKVSFISRKGSDCLSKWIGESEKRLRDIFIRAKQTRPCIIFFDEVDGLAPVRSSRQDFVHTSVVSTLLALMDGLDNNSEVIVIGATNRLEAIDPALRRPGRFDKELYFPLPCFKTRNQILSVHVSNWKQKPPIRFLSYLASKTIGFCGSDLQALCAEAVMCCVRRNYPQIYTSKSKHRINGRSLKVNKQDFLTAYQKIIPASHRIAVSPVKRLTTKIRPLLEQTLSLVITKLQVLCPKGMLSSDETTGIASSKSSGCPKLILTGDGDSHSRHLGPAILHELEHLPCHVLDITTLYEVTGRAAEEAIIQRVKEARHTLPSVLYVPDITAWWELVEEPARVVFTSLIRGLDRTVTMLVLTTANCPHGKLPGEIQSLYEHCQGEVYEVMEPETAEREAFFEQLFFPTESTTSIPENLSQKSSSDVVEISPHRKVSSEINARAKLSCVQSTQSASYSGTVLKREYSAAGEAAGPSKRPRMASDVTIARQKSKPVFAKLPHHQMTELLRRTVVLTYRYSLQQLESLYAFLEMAIENGEGDMFKVIIECLRSFRETRQLKKRISRENERFQRADVLLDYGEDIDKSMARNNSKKKRMVRK